MSMKVVAGVSLGCMGVIVLVCAVSGWRMYSAATATFAEAREGLVTQIDGPAEPSGPPPEPFAPRLERVRYPAPLGENWAYASPVRGQGRAAVVYVVGGFSFEVDPSFALGGPFDNDQTGSELERPDIAVILPSFRGTHDNPGHDECLLGEVDDVLAAAAYMRTRADVDPRRVYLVGHSTGGTLVLMAAQQASALPEAERPRGVFALAPVGAVTDYGDACLPFDAEIAERNARRPLSHMRELQIPTVLVEGAQGNASSLDELMAAAGDAPVSGFLLPGHDHFTSIAATVRVIGELIAADTGPTPSLTLAPLAIENALRDGPRPLCGLHRFEGAPPPSAPADFASRPGEEWPVMVLTNTAHFRGHTALEGAAAFLLRRPGANEVLLATALHLVGPNGGVEPSLIDAAAFTPDDFDAALQRWQVHPRTRAEQALAAGPLAERATLGDWLLLRTAPGAQLPSTVLELASRVASVGDSVFLVGCPYGEPACVQHVYRGTVTARTPSGFRYSVNPPVRVQGFSGGPILNADGHVLGVFSVSSDLVVDAEGRHTEGEADDTLIAQMQDCAAPSGGGVSR